MGHVIGVAVANRMAIFELGVVCEVFGIDRSDITAPWYDLRLCATEPAPLRTTSGLLVDTRYGLADLARADTIIVPAAAKADQIAPPSALLDLLRDAHARGVRIASICGGAYILAAAGLLDGLRATCHWMNAEDLAARYPKVTVDPSVLYVDNGSVLTSAGTGAAIDLCLHLVRTDHGSAVANEIARRMVVPPHREGGQAQFAPPVPRAESPLSGMSSVLDWARHHLDLPLTVADLAARAHLSERTFARRFTGAMGVSPLRWLTLQRVRVAQELLEATDEPVEAIARRVGFGTAANLRLHFGRVTSVPPQTYRTAFRTAGAGT